jgi:GNAT superfamily N-acetyltransferase
MVDQWTRVWGTGAPEEVIQHWFNVYANLPFGPDRALRLYLGSIDGKPVGTVALFLAAGVASINWVVTLHKFRRQGIGAAMTLRAAREARSAGYRVGVLTASPLGINIYRRMGFKEYCQVSTYEWGPSDD